MKEQTKMKSTEQLIKLAQNPYYTLSYEEKQALEQIQPDEVSISSTTETSQKKQSLATRENATVKETGKLAKHSTEIVSE